MGYKLILVLFVLWTFPGWGQTRVEEIEILGRGFSVEEDSLVVQVIGLDDRMIHIRVYPQGKPGNHSSMVVDDAQFASSQFKVHRKKRNVILQTSALRVEYDIQEARIRFVDAKTGKGILNEKTREFRPVRIPGDIGYQVCQTFTLSPGEAVYGLGQYQEGAFNYRGQTVKLVHANREIANPVLLSSNNYLLYWDNYSKTIFSDTPDGASFWSDLGDRIDYYFVYGDDMNDAIVRFRHLTGQVPMFPKSAFGFWISKERYKSFDELTGVVAEYRRRDIPLDNVVQDWQYWGEDLALWNSMVFDSLRFPRPKQAIERLHRDFNVKLTLSVWPGVGKKTAVYQAMDSAGVLFDVPTWAGYKVVDIYHPKAREIYWKHLYKGLYLQGVDSWWMDATEPSFRDGLYQDKQEQWTKQAGMTYIGSFYRYLNTYSLALSGMLYENLRKESNKRVSILTRSAFAGQQKYATSTWSGDIYASWDVFKKQIPAGLNLCMTGLPYWTTDIGGFRVITQEKSGEKATGEIGGFVDETKVRNDGGYRKGLKDPAYLELYTRWFQYGAFNPLFRAHGSEVPREIWHFGEPGTPYYDAQLKMIHLRYTLLSYIYSTAWLVTSAGATMMRPLVMDFPQDTVLRHNADGYMFGDALLVYPVTRPMFYDRNGKIEKPDARVSVYLPAHSGKYWFDFNADKCYLAGQTISYDAPLDVIPVFVKAGSIMPRNKVVSHVGADDNREMDILVYTGQDAVFTLYEDDNETYDYEQGDYSAITIRWNEKRRELTFDRPEGELKNRLPERIFNVRILDTAKEGGVSELHQQIRFTNARQKITLK